MKKYSLNSIKTLLLNLPLIWSLIWRKITRHFKKGWSNIILSCRKIEAKWLHNTKGGTYYVVMFGWRDIRVLDKRTYEYCKKFIKKKYGKELRRNVIYRADGTLIKNPNWVGNLEE